tara:strand:- start:10126 stop:10296 length:171 start_codon:yes stop_codon:yes gene_type:complete
MIERSTDDRRIKNIKVVKDRRKIRRRQDDKDNIKAYYIVLGFSIFLFTFIGVASFI